jgi:transcriptional regulator with XRE-family HTH domain
MKNTAKEVGKRFKTLRETELGLTQTQMALQLGYKTQGQYSKIELGQVFPSMLAYQELAKKYKVRTAWMMEEEGRKYMTDAEHKKYLEQFVVEDDTPSVMSDKAELMAELEKIKQQVKKLEAKIDKME